MIAIGLLLVIPCGDDANDCDMPGIAWPKVWRGASLALVPRPS